MRTFPTLKIANPIFLLFGFTLLTAFLTTQSVAAESLKIPTPNHGEITLHFIEPTSGFDGEGVDGDTYDFQHQVGAFIDGSFQCFSEHMSGMDDNVVTFDSITEFLDTYLDGTQPGIFESIFNLNGPEGEQDIFINTFADIGEDLFPEGFEDPVDGTPLDDACFEIGKEDLLDFDDPMEVTSATIQASGDNGTIIPPTDITSFFSNPWDGRMSIVFPGGAGAGINGMTLDITVAPAPFDPQPIFADGFESGDASSWTDSTP